MRWFWIALALLTGFTAAKAAGPEFGLPKISLLMLSHYGTANGNSSPTVVKVGTFTTVDECHNAILQSQYFDHGGAIFRFGEPNNSLQVIMICIREEAPPLIKP